MEDFTIVDGVAVALLVLSTLLAYSRGFVREALAIGGWVAAIVLGYILADWVRPLLISAPVLDDILADQCEFALLASFAAVMVASLLVMWIFTSVVSGLMKRSILSAADRMLGLLFGLARGVLLIVAALIAYEFAVTEETSIAVITESRTASILGDLQDSIEERVPDNIPGWLQARSDTFLAACE